MSPALLWASSFPPFLSRDFLHHFVFFAKKGREGGGGGETETETKRERETGTDRQTNRGGESD